MTVYLHLFTQRSRYMLDIVVTEMQQMIVISTFIIRMRTTSVARIYEVVIVPSYMYVCDSHTKHRLTRAANP